MATTGHEQEVIDVEGLKASLQKFKTNIHDALGLSVVNGKLCQTYTTT